MSVLLLEQVLPPGGAHRCPGTHPFLPGRCGALDPGAVGRHSQDRPFVAHLSGLWDGADTLGMDWRDRSVPRAPARAQPSVCHEECAITVGDGALSPQCQPSPKLHRQITSIFFNVWPKPPPEHPVHARHCPHSAWYLESCLGTQCCPSPAPQGNLLHPPPLDSP